MPRYRATISGSDLDQVDGLLREARVGVVVVRDVEDGTGASGTPTEAPETETLEASIDGENAGDAERKVTDALGSAYSVAVHES